MSSTVAVWRGTAGGRPCRSAMGKRSGWRKENRSAKGGEGRAARGRGKAARAAGRGRTKTAFARCSASRRRRRCTGARRSPRSAASTSGSAPGTRTSTWRCGLRAAGFRALHVPAARALHAGGATARRRPWRYGALLYRQPLAGGRPPPRPPLPRRRPPPPRPRPPRPRPPPLAHPRHQGRLAPRPAPPAALVPSRPACRCAGRARALHGGLIGSTGVREGHAGSLGWGRGGGGSCGRGDRRATESTLEGGSPRRPRGATARALPRPVPRPRSRRPHARSSHPLPSRPGPSCEEIWRDHQGPRIVDLISLLGELPSTEAKIGPTSSSVPIFSTPRWRSNERCGNSSTK